MRTTPKCISFLIFFFLFFAISFSQNRHKTDSLLTILKVDHLTKKDRAIALEELSFYHPKLDSALYFANESLSLSKELKDKLLQAEAYEGISMIEQRFANNSQSLDAAFKALLIYQEFGLKNKEAAIHTQIAANYLSEKDYTFAIDYYKKAHKIYKEFSKSKEGETLTLINLGEAYRLSGNFTEAERCFLKVLDLNKVINNDVILGYTSGNLGMVYSSQNQLEKGKEEIEKAISILSKLEDHYSESIYIAELGQIYRKENNYLLADNKLTQAFKIAKNNGLKEQIRDFSKMLVVLNEERRDFEKAFNYQEIYQTYQDSLINRDNIKKIEQLKSKNEIDKREFEIKRINEVSNNRKSVAIGLSFGVLLFAIFSYVLYNLNKRIQQTNISLSKREEEKALLLKELNHRVKNNLQMISSLLNLQSRSLTQEKAKQLIKSGRERVEALSLVHRKLYQEGIETKIVVRSYVEELVLNLINSYDIDIEPEFIISEIDINVDKAIPLALIINELVTNSIKYAYHNIAKPKLLILIEEKDNGLYMQISDNGIGITKKEKNKNGSLGLSLITSLTEQLEGTVKTENSNGTHWFFNSLIIDS